MGQGVYTAIAQILAEELDADFAQVVLEHAPPNDKLYGNPIFRVQVTGNSNSIRAFWKPLRIAGAAARAMLVQAAAQQWQVDPASCSASNGKVTHAASGTHARLWRSGGCGGQCSGAARSAAQGPERFRADRQAAQALRHARQDQRQGHLWHRRDAARHEVRDIGRKSGIRRQGRSCRRQCGQDRPRRATNRCTGRSCCGRRRSHVGGQERSRRSRHHLERRRERKIQFERHLGRLARREQKRRCHRKIA